MFFNNFHAKLHCVCCVFVFMKESPNFIVNNIEKKKNLKNEFVSGSMRMRKLRTTNGSMKPKKKEKKKPKVVKRKKKMMMTTMMPKFQIHSVLTHHRKHRKT